MRVGRGDREAVGARLRGADVAAEGCLIRKARRGREREECGQTSRGETKNEVAAKGRERLHIRAAARNQEPRAIRLQRIFRKGLRKLYLKPCKQIV